MKTVLLFMDAVVFFLVIVEGRSLIQDEESGLSLIHLFRAKRFDFSMFGCSECRPVAKCRSDHECVMRRGRGFTCEYRCCSFICVKPNSNRAAHVDDVRNNDDVTGNDQDEETLDVSKEIPTYESEEDRNSTESITSTEIPLAPTKLLTSTLNSTDGDPNR